MKTVITRVLACITKYYFRSLLKIDSDLYIKKRYKMLFGEDIDFQNPVTFAEKIQWLKRNDRDERIVNFADKYLVREHVQKTVGEEYLIPLVDVWDKADDLVFDNLPNAFVLKPNNSSGRVFICKNKAEVDKKKMMRTIRKWEKENLTKITGEWEYEKIPYKLICEEFLEDKITDYKMYFADGVFICTQVIAGRADGHKQFGYFDGQWNLLNIKRYGIEALQRPIEKPEKYEEMVAVATKLAQNFTFIRVDLYCVKGKIYFGELSFYPNNGFVRYENEEMDRFFASKIHLPN